MPGDPFDTASLRRAALIAWSASAARLREDANAEEALVLGGYGGRVLVELAANAVDAARAAGVPARLRIRLGAHEQSDTASDLLSVANTGAPLTADGVAALASLRASAKRDDAASVGHFGVGFTAVLGWSDAPRVVSESGGVEFDRGRTAAAIAELGNTALDRELARRAGAAPALRLPWPTADDEPPPPPGYATEVRLPLADAEAVRRELADPDTVEDLMWAVPELAAVDLAGDGVPALVTVRTIDLNGVHTLTAGPQTRRYRTARRYGQLSAELLADRPLEERARSGWWVTWAHELRSADRLEVDLGVGEAGIRAGIGAGIGPEIGAGIGATAATVRRTIGAPTPTDEPCTLPARLVGTFPVDDTRRRLSSGPLTDHLLRRAVGCYLDLVAATPPDERWALIPAGGFPAGDVDATLRAGVLDGFATTPLLRSAVGDEVTAADAVVLPELSAAGAALIGQAVPGLLGAAAGGGHGRAPRGRRPLDHRRRRQLRARRHRPAPGVLAAGVRRAGHRWIVRRTPRTSPTCPCRWSAVAELSAPGDV